MRTVIQRVQHASVAIDGAVRSEIRKGLLILVGFEDSDTDKEIVRMAKKIVNMRIFDDDKGVMNRSVLEIGGEILIVSQFTLYASTKKGESFVVYSCRETGYVPRLMQLLARHPTDRATFMDRGCRFLMPIRSESR